MDELAARIPALYERHAHAFDAARDRALPERAWLARFAEHVPAGGEVLDLACGHGEPIAAWLVGCGLRVTGVDTSPTLLGLARARLPRGTWVLADMRGLALGRRFEGLLAWDGFFHLRAEDQRGMFAIFAAHVAPGAPLLFNTGPAAGVAIGALGGEPLHHASLDPDVYRALLDAHGFDVLAFVPEDATCGGRTVWLARRR
jgi:SAM-dependent methyltransferase